MNLIKLQRSGISRLSSFHDELERLFNSRLGGGAPDSTSFVSWVPALDVYEEKDNYVVKAELPGLTKEEVQLSLEKGTLTISGERKSEAKNEGTEVYYSERSYGRFQRTINLPESVAADQVKAQFKDGILTVTLPKSEEAKPKKIDITLNN
jgi:HSP20 family protein